MTTEEDDLQAFWADIRAAKRPPPPPLFTQVSDLIHTLVKGPTAFNSAEVLVGLLTDQGIEVDAREYARVPSQMRRNGQFSMCVNPVTFPTATSNWGRITTIGIYTTHGEALFYLHANEVTVLTGDTYNLFSFDLCQMV